jgi:hypothetical protein
MGERTDDDAHARDRLRDLLHDSAPDDGAVPIERLMPPRRRRSRSPAVAGAVGVVLAVVLAVTLANRGSTQREPNAAARPRAGSHPPAPSVEARRLAEFAERAPCRLIEPDRHQADARQVARFDAVAVVQCANGTRRYAGDGEWATLARRVATTGMPRLLTALKRPDERARSGVACAAIAYGPLDILLVDRHGRYLHPRFPETGCGAPQPAFSSALAALRWRTVSVTRVQQLRSQAAIDSGCEMAWKNLHALLIGPARAAPSGPVLTERPRAALQICLYGRSKDPDAGSFRRGLTLTGAPAAALRTALGGAGSASSCPLVADFAVVFAGGPWVEVELGGCWRVLRGDTVGTASPSAVTSLLGLR